MQRRKHLSSITLGSIRAKSTGEHVADALVNSFGTVVFLCANIFFFVGWVVVNMGLIPSVSVFDPFPFVLLTTIVSLEAIFLSVVVLISQNKASKVADIREEIDFRVNVETEKEITKVLCILEVMEKHMNIRLRHDKVLSKMERPLNIERIAKEVMEERLRS